MYDGQVSHIPSVQMAYKPFLIEKQMKTDFYARHIRKSSSLRGNAKLKIQDYTPA